MFKNKLKKAIKIKKEASNISSQVAMYGVNQIINSGDMVDYIVLLLARYKFISPVEVSYAKSKMTKALNENRSELESVISKIIDSYLSDDAKRYGYNYGNSGRKTDPYDSEQGSGKNYDESMDRDLSGSQVGQGKQESAKKNDKPKDESSGSGSGSWESNFLTTNLGTQ